MYKRLDQENLEKKIIMKSLSKKFNNISFLIQSKGDI